MSKISQKMMLKQQQSPQQVLHASLLQLSLPLLEQRILKELESNPALEIVDSENDEQHGELIEEKDEVEKEVEFEWEELLGVNDEYEYPKTYQKKEDELDSPIIAKETFVEQIIKQLQDCNLNMKELEISEQVLGNLDDQGYLTIEPSLISDRMDLDEQDVLKVMYKIQRLDPPGLASQNIQECLQVQAEVGNENSEAKIILSDFFDDFVNHRYEKIIDKLGCSKDEFNEAMEYIARLNPSPREEYTIVNPDIIVPDVAVENRDGEYHVVIQDSSIPDVKVSEAYIKMLNQHNDKKDVKQFVKKKLESATWFVEAIQQRKHTIQQVVESIIKFQFKYFNSDERKLKPMILKDIAEDIKMDISTVSRVTNGKYVQLPWEIKELKTFFSEGIQTNEGQFVSNTMVKNRLKEIIDNEDKFNPISDNELTSMLNSEGYKIARRTITKYREQFKIATARLRRKLK